jgi:hypothetical protein
MKAIRPAAVLLALTAFHSTAHDVITTPITFSREISRLLYSRCVSCHHEGGAAFSLTTYEQARPWAKAIKDEVLERRMPPWGAVKGFADFRDDQSLTQEQLELISDWVEGGAPEGDAQFLPKLPDFQRPWSATAPAGINAPDGLTLKNAAMVTGVGVKNASDGASFMAVAELPDGAVEPLLWLYAFNAKFAHPFWYSNSLRLPSGARIVITPPEAGQLVLLTGRR